MIKKFRGIVSLLLCVVLLFGNVAVGGEGFADFVASVYDALSIRASAVESGTCGDNLTWTLSDDGVLTISGTGDMKDFTYNSSDAWRQYKTLIKELIIGQEITSIGSYAFNSCLALTNVEFPDSIVSIGLCAFESCERLTNIVIPDSVTSIGGNAFGSCYNLEYITIGDGITSIDGGVIGGCSIFSIDGNLKSITIGKGVASIGEGIISQCCNLESITVSPDNPVYHSAGNCIIETASKTLISGCKNSVIPSDGSVTSIGNFAFILCENLENIIIPSSVTSIGDSAFFECYALKSITFPESVTSIGDYAFLECYALESITIYDSITSIGEKAFLKCNKLTDVYYTGAEEQWNEINISEGNEKLLSADIHYVIEPLSVLEYEINDGKVTITGCNQNANGEIVIPETIEGYPVTSIGKNAFQNCSELTDLIIPASVTSIDTNPFTGCTGLESITVDENNTVYHSSGNCLIDTESKTLVAGCKNSVIPADGSVTSIGNAAFGGCSGLAELTVPPCVSKIGDGAFSLCSGLNKLVVYSPLTGTGAFNGCSGLKTAGPIGGGYDFEFGWFDTIPPYAFYGCSGLERIILPNSIGEIGYSAFSYCSSLESIKIPFFVTTIYGGSDYLEDLFGEIGSPGDSPGKGTFYGCTSLTNVIIGKNVTTIGPKAFFNCPNLTNVYYLGSADEWREISIVNNNGYNDSLVNANIIYNSPSSLAFLVYSINNNEVTITGIDIRESNFALAGIMPDSTEFVIPDSIEGYPVTSIRFDAFNNCTELTAISIPGSVNDIEPGAFSGCSSLESLIVSNDNPVYHSDGNCIIKTDSKTLIAGCKNSNIPDDGSVTSIENRAFYGCKNLENIEIPEGIETIGAFAFYGCEKLKNVNIPDSVSHIALGAFSGCSGIDSLSVSPDNPVYHSSGNCIIRTQTGSLALGCKNSVIPTDGSVQTVGIYAFVGCSELEHIAIPDGVTSIGDYAFSGCSGLSFVVIPDSVTTIEHNAFSGCNGLTDVYYKGTEEQWNEIESGDNNENLLNANITYNFVPGEYTLNIGYRMVDGNDAVKPADYSASFALDESYSVTSPAVTGYTPDIAAVEGRMDSLDGKTETVNYIPDIYYENNLFDVSEWYNNLKTKPNNGTNSPDAKVSLSGEKVVFETGENVQNPDCYTLWSAGNGDTSYYKIPCEPNTEYTFLYNVELEGEGISQIILFEYAENYTDPIAGEIGWHVLCPDYQSDAGTYVKTCTTAENAAYIGVRVGTAGVAGTKAAYSNIMLLKTSDIKPYTITYRYGEVNGNAVYKTITQNFGAAVTPPDDPEFSGYTFVGWDSEIPGTMPAENLTINALWISSTGTYGPLTYRIDNNKEVTITDCDKEATGELVIPETIDGYPVTSIGGNAFRYCRLTNIEISNSIKRIDDYAFFNCNGFTNIDIPYGVETIGNSAFAACFWLTDINIPNSVISIGSSAFERCSKLKSVEIPNSVSSIGSSAFRDCTGLTSIEIPDSVTSISNSAFSGCTGLTSIEIPNNVTSIGNSAFSGCSGLESITVSQGNSIYHSTNNCLIETVSSTLILGCKNSVIPADGSVMSIGDSAFYNCSGLTSINIPDSVTSIGDAAFKDCTRPTNATIPSSVTSIGSSAFSGCTGLTSIEIPDSVTSIGSSAFSGCTRLTEITIPGSVKNIESRMFEDCTGLESVTIGNGVESLGDLAFLYCLNLKEIELPESVTSIGWLAFYVCRDLEKITVSQGNPVYHSADNCVIETATDTLTLGCKTSVIPADGSVTKIGHYAFAGCIDLKSITIPVSVTDIGVQAFELCVSLKDVTILENVETIGEGAFYYVGNISYSENMTAEGSPWGARCVNGFVDDNLIYSDESRTELCACSTTAKGEITIPSSVTNIGDYAFVFCEGITDVTIGSGVESIGESAFAFCSGLASVTVPVGVKNIGASAFTECFNLTDVNYTGTEEQWNEISIASDNEPLLNANIKYYDGSLTINYLIEGSDEPLREAYKDSSLSYGDSYSVVSPEVPGYHLVDDGQTTVNGVMDFDPVSVNVYYAPGDYPLTINYVMSDGNNAAKPENHTENITFNTAYSFPSPAVTGYTPDVDVVTGTMDAEGKTVTVTYSPNIYSIKYYVDGKVYLSVKVAFGSEVTAPENPQKLSYLFAGWTPEVPATMPAKNLSFNALWTDVYGIGEETYSFKNFSNKDIKCSHRNYNGHCFGMAATSSGYYIGKLDKADIGGENKTLYSLSINNNKVREPICTYLLIQGPVGPFGTKGAEREAIVAGGSIDLKKEKNTSSDWNACVNYIKNHKYDYKGSLNVGVWYKDRGGHAVNFLYYKEVNNQQRIYVYDSNYPGYEMYYYKKGSYIYENSDDPRYKYGDSPAIKGIDLMDVATYFDYAKSVSLLDYIFTSIKSVEIENAEYSYMKCDGELSDYVIFKIPEGVEEVKITPLEDNASFEYMGVEYTFGKVDEDTYGVLEVLTESAEEGKKTEFVIENAPAQVQIKNYVPERTDDYRTSITFTATITDLNDDVTVHWFINGKDSGTGKTFKVEEAKADYTVQAKLIDKSGKTTSESEKETVKIKHGFFDIIIWFFRHLFNPGAYDKKQ